MQESLKLLKETAKFIMNENQWKVILKKYVMKTEDFLNAETKTVLSSDMKAPKKLQDMMRMAKPEVLI